MPAQTFVDTEGAVKAWAKANAAIAALVGVRVFLGVNDNDAAFPQIVVQTIAGAPDDGDAAIDYPVVQIDCWATSRKAAAELALAVLGEVRGLTDGTAMGDTAVGLGARVLSTPRYLTTAADETAHRYRYTFDVEFALRAA